MLADYSPLFKNKNFMYLWASQILSQVTVNMLNFILIIRLFDLTGSAIAISLLWVSYAVPSMFIGPIASASVDMVDKRRLLIITNLLQSLTIFIYSFIHQTTIYLLYTVAFLYSLLNQFYVPAESASLPQIVKNHDLPLGNSMFFLTQQTALILGFGLAGPLVNLIGFKNGLLVCSFLLFLAYFNVTMLPVNPVKEKIFGKIEEIFTDVFKKILDGIRIIKNEKYVLFPLALLIGIQVALSVLIINIPIIADEVFRIPLFSAGMLIIVPAGIGSAMGAFYIPNLLKKGTRKYVLIEKFFGTIIIGLAVFIFLIPNMPPIYKEISGFMLSALMGLSFVGVVIPTQTFLQEKTPENYRGRVFGNYWFLVTIITILPVILSGTIIEFLGIRSLLIILLIGTFWIYWQLKDKKKMLIAG